jgi:Cyclin-dependent kinase inhibitor 3 (CDKN3)
VLALISKRLLVPTGGSRLLGTRLRRRALVPHPVSSSAASQIPIGSARRVKRTQSSFQSSSTLAHHHSANPTRMITTHEKNEDLKDENQEEDDTIITPRDPTTLFNFGPASSRDDIVFTCERPGGDLVHEESGATSTSTTSTIIPSQAVKEWAQFMKNEDNRINDVLVLLDDSELECYEEPGLVALYEQYGFTVHRVPMGDPDAPARVLALLSSYQDDDDNNGRNDTKTTHQRKIVVHCTHGQGRAGRVAAAWLTHQYGLSPEDATREVLNTALQMGITRMGSPSKLRAWLRKEQLKKEEHSSV